MFKRLQSLFRRTPLFPSVTFATGVWEKDWRAILLDRSRLQIRQIGNHSFPFAEKLLLINNVDNLPEVLRVAHSLIQDGFLTRIAVCADLEEEMLSFFQLKRADFRVGPDASQYSGVNPDWIYYNALPPLTAIYACKTPYLLYLTGDVTLDHPCDWISPSLQAMEANPVYAVANPIWNRAYKEAKRESSHKRGPFYVAPQGFSDQLFLVKTERFRQPIYGEVRSDAVHYTRGDVFEKRAFSAMKNRGWQRLIYRRCSYTHQNF